MRNEVELLRELVAIESISGHEDEIAKFVDHVARKLGLEAIRDETGVKVLIDRLTATHIPDCPYAVLVLDELGREADLAIVIGGDGTMLNIARTFAPSDVALVGVPMDLGGGLRGVDMGPSAIRLAGLTARIEQLGWRVREMGSVFVREPEAMFWVFVFPILMAGLLGVAFRSRPPEALPVAVIAGAHAKARATALSVGGDVAPRILSEPDARLALTRGQVLLVVNVASKCGFTPQYKGLEALHRRLAGKGLAVLGFPCNQFGKQEPGDADEIKKFCSTKYDVSFPLFAKIDVNGAKAHPLYKFLKREAKGVLRSEAVKWNFTKFLVDRNGKVLRRYAPSDKPQAIEQEILDVL